MFGFFFPDCFSVHVVSDVHEDFPDIPLKMAPRKGISTFSRKVSEGLSDQSYWYVLTTDGWNAE